MLVDAQGRSGSWEICRDGRGNGLAGLEAVFWGLRHDWSVSTLKCFFKITFKDDDESEAFVISVLVGDERGLCGNLH